MASRRTEARDWGVEIRREVDILTKAINGDSPLSFTVLALATEATAADKGAYADSSGRRGFAWQPSVYADQPNPALARMLAAAASLGRIMAGGNPSHRSYLAFMEAVYQVTAAQDYDITKRVEELWDERTMATETLTEIPVAEPPPHGLISRLVGWLRRLFGRSREAPAIKN